jgi:hypothetical protein
MHNEQTGDTGNDSLDGVTGLGAARKALLHAAGITTRAELSRMAPERLMRVARMPRHQADRTLASLRTAPADSAETVPPGVAPAESGSPPEPKKPSPPTPPPAAPPETAAPAADEPHSLAARLRFLLFLLGEPAQTKAPRLVKPLSRLAALLEDAAGSWAALPPKKRRRVAEGLRALADRLDAALLGTAAVTPKRTKRLRARVREERHALAGILGLKPRRRRKPKPGH